MARKASFPLHIKNLGQIREADFELADLTVFVGPQATGIALQAFKLAVDLSNMANRLLDFGFQWNDANELCSLVFGEGMGALWTRGSEISFRGKPVELDQVKRRRPSNANVYYVPAQRTLLLAGGRLLAFQQHSPDTPFVAREYSEIVRDVLQKLLTGERVDLFPLPGRLDGAIRTLVDESVFHGARLYEDRVGLQRQLKLKIPGDVTLSYMSWTAGQREFIPLLLGLYRLLPSQAKTKVKEIEWVVIEEPEMGLHPKAIVTVMLLVLELLDRGYRVLLSTHSPAVLDVVWGLRMMKAHGADAKMVARIFRDRPGKKLQEIGESALDSDYRVYYFDHDPSDNRVAPKDISSLDPGSEDMDVSGWGGLTSFGSRVSRLVSEVLAAEER